MSIKDDIAVARLGARQSKDGPAEAALDRIEEGVASLVDSEAAWKKAHATAVDDKMKALHANGELAGGTVDAIVERDQAKAELAEAKSKLESIDRITAEHAEAKAMLESALEERDDARGEADQAARDRDQCRHDILGWIQKGEALEGKLKMAEECRDELQRRVAILEGRMAEDETRRKATHDMLERMTAVAQSLDLAVCKFLDAAHEWNEREPESPLPGEIQEGIDELRASEKFIHNEKSPVPDLMKPFREALGGARKSVETMQRLLQEARQEASQAGQAAVECQRDTQVLVRAIEIVGRVNTQVRASMSASPQGPVTQEARPR